MTAAAVYWPLFDLVIRTRRLELRVPTDEDYAAICDLSRKGVHDPAVMPFAVEWTDAAPEDLGRLAYQFLWETRAQWRPDAWHLELAVYHDGEPIGMKGLWCTDFGLTGEVSTGAWLGLAHQGFGFGKEMRAAVLHLAFTGLGAEWAVSQSFADNPASIAVNRHHGYTDDGFEIRARRGVAAHWHRFRLARNQWLAGRGRDYPVRIEGLDGCRAMFVPRPRSAT